MTVDCKGNRKFFDFYIKKKILFFHKKGVFAKKFSKIILEPKIKWAGNWFLAVPLAFLALSFQISKEAFQTFSFIFWRGSCPVPPPTVASNVVQFLVISQKNIYAYLGLVFHICSGLTPACWLRNLLQSHSLDTFRRALARDRAENVDQQLNFLPPCPLALEEGAGSSMPACWQYGRRV